MRIVEQRRVAGLASLYLAELRNNPGLLIEFVDTLEPGVPKRDKWVMMVSTQFGCPVGCRMCDAGSLGFQGNLTAEEIMEQIRLLVRFNPGLNIQRHPKAKIHFARMGEPALNPATLEALRLLGREFGYPGILPSISTVAPKSAPTFAFFEELLRIKDAYYAGGRFQLQFSVHSLDEEKRRMIVPVKKWSLEDISRFGERFVKPGDRKITLNFALGPDEARDPGGLDHYFSPEKFLVKITPVNPTAASNRSQTTNVWQKAPEPIMEYAGRLKKEGFDVILSPSLPQEIDAATSCGQLWSAALKKRARLTAGNLLKDVQSYVHGENLPAKTDCWKTQISELNRRKFVLDAEKAGLLIVDMQEFFLSPRSEAYLPASRAIFSNVRLLAETFRAAGRPVFYSLHAHKNPSLDGGLMTLMWKKVCLAGTPEARVSPALEPREGEVFRKCRYSVFSNPKFEAALYRGGVEHLVVAGVMTNLCVESTVRSAFDFGFKTFVAMDATAAQSEELHLASLRNLACGFSSVSTTRDFIEQLTGVPA
ncbi:MAG: isochorismatase family protein [Elusimicrobia bacterium]|nr:isochorismatase family protein [Elusimicrobiota bacterium]